MRVAGYVNRFNRGIATAEEVLSDNGNPAPVFNFKTQWVFGVTIFENPLAVIPKSDVGINVGINKGEDTDATILEIIKNNPGIKIKSISESLGLTPLKIERYLKTMKGSTIEYRGSLKTGGYFVM